MTTKILDGTRRAAVQVLVNLSALHQHPLLDGRVDPETGAVDLEWIGDLYRDEVRARGVVEEGWSAGELLLLDVLRHLVGSGPGALRLDVDDLSSLDQPNRCAVIYALACLYDVPVTGAER